MGCEPFSRLNCHHFFAFNYLKNLPILGCYGALIALLGYTCIFPWSTFISKPLHFSQGALLLISISWDFSHQDPPVLGTGSGMGARI